ncbi:MAG: hypothetical protein ASARMPRED_003079 [Alectoria sarmentosa]|nr:MAG: hypothetical protein ASARMPRED_003079 [Alectoria sarmentosa]
MNSPTDFDLHASGLSSIDVDDHSGGVVITTSQRRRQGRFPLLRLPKEIRLHVLSFLLPDVDQIDSGNEWGCIQDAGESITADIWTTYRHDNAPCEMAVMQTSRQIYEETAGYLYDRLTVIVHIEDNGVDFLTAHWGCGCVEGCLDTNIPLHKFRCVWLQVQASYDQPRHLVHVRRNIVDFCSMFYRLESLKCLRVDFWDSSHCQAGTRWGFEEPTSIQGGVEVATKDLEDLMEYVGYDEKTVEQQIWRAANSTGTALVSTDIELILQPLKLLRNVSSCQIFLNPHLQEHTSLVELVASYKEMIESKEELVLEDLMLVHATSEDLYRLARSVHGEGLYHLHSTEKERMESLLWRTRKWHSIRAESCVGTEHASVRDGFLPAELLWWSGN